MRLLLVASVLILGLPGNVGAEELHEEWVRAVDGAWEGRNDRHGFYIEISTYEPSFYPDFRKQIPWYGGDYPEPEPFRDQIGGQRVWNEDKKIREEWRGAKWNWLWNAEEGQLEAWMLAGEAMAIDYHVLKLDLIDAKSAKGQVFLAMGAPFWETKKTYAIASVTVTREDADSLSITYHDFSDKLSCREMPFGGCTYYEIPLTGRAYKALKGRLTIILTRTAKRKITRGAMCTWEIKPSGTTDAKPARSPDGP